MTGLKLVVFLPLLAIVQTIAAVAPGIGYYGSSNVRDQSYYKRSIYPTHSTTSSQIAGVSVPAAKVPPVPLTLIAAVAARVNQLPPPRQTSNVPVKTTATPVYVPTTSAPVNVNVPTVTVVLPETTGTQAPPVISSQNPSNEIVPEPEPSVVDTGSGAFIDVPSRPQLSTITTAATNPIPTNQPTTVPNTPKPTTSNNGIEQKPEHPMKVYSTPFPSNPSEIITHPPTQTPTYPTQSSTYYTEPPRTLPPPTAAPVTTAPLTRSTLPPRTLPPVTLPPTTAAPPTTPPVTAAPVTRPALPPRTLPPVTLPPTAAAPPTAPPVTATPITRPALPPRTLPPVTLPPTTAAPPTAPPVTAAPITHPMLPPRTLPPVTLPPTTLAPPTAPPVTAAPITHPMLPPRTLPPVTLPPTTLAPPTAPPVTAAPITQPTLPLITLPPANLPPTTAAQPTYLPAESRNTTITYISTQPPAITESDIVQGYNCQQANGYFSVANKCDSYVECKGNIAVSRICPDGLHFNPKSKYAEYPCAYPVEVQCTAGLVTQTPIPTSQCANLYGFFPMSNGDCSKYIVCQDGIANIMTCPPGLVFNKNIDDCDWPINVPSCNLDIFKGFKCPSQPDSDLIEKFRFKGSCTSYIACQRGHPRLLSCDYGLYYEEATQSCVDASRVKDCTA
ncbi:hypothetical protein K1T71_003153 [Dendrolimus kikuchii]|uniref:Uncharacterized protein n=1 Tax=Dendrolimus kikuchii TaxID=765133 RepID=A0ACC1DAX0_9NEOP|nr:hypothetical protein K1T71_003153 [Dendrolimus kikuchii]